MSKPYHHGNLREALIDAACELIAQKGPQGFTLSEASKMAGVSGAAPYRHFPSKDDLLLQISNLGYLELTGKLKAARNSESDPTKALLAMGHAYLVFSVEQKGEYMAMFESKAPYNDDEDQNTPRYMAYRELIDGSKAILQSFPVRADVDIDEMAKYIWALAHGVASLFARNSPDITADTNAQKILENGLIAYIKGLQA